jgi:hypothetical protein
VLATALMVIGRVMRFTRRIAESDGFLCLNCHYDLHGLPDVGECPECGEAYVRADLERRWNLWLQSQTKHKHTIRPRSDATVRPESSERNRRGEHGTKT